VGWYLPEVAARRAERDEFDVVEGAGHQGRLRGGGTQCSLDAWGWVAAWPRAAITAAVTREALVEHWRALGLPTFAQFDNDTRFQGPHQYPDTIGTVIRLCLSLGSFPCSRCPTKWGYKPASKVSMVAGRPKSGPAFSTRLWRRSKCRLWLGASRIFD
jgi:hypothetical protein